MRVLFLIFMFILGAALGSFLCCQARRLHLKTVKKGKKLGNRSICLKCGTKLNWYDNIPILSWLLLRGKCRKCRARIGVAELFSELGVGLVFLGFGNEILEYLILSPSLSIVPIISLVITFLLILSLSFLAIYDGIYGELPLPLLIFSIVCAAVAAVLRIWNSFVGFPDSLPLIGETLGAVAVLGGLYLILYLVSKGKWVGDGDWLLGTALGLAIGKPWHALIILFLANLLACLYALPKLKKSKNRKIFLGPFLVAAFFITLFLSSEIDALFSYCFVY